MISQAGNMQLYSQEPINVQISETLNNKFTSKGEKYLQMSISNIILSGQSEDLGFWLSCYPSQNREGQPGRKDKGTPWKVKWQGEMQPRAVWVIVAVIVLYF